MTRAEAMAEIQALFREYGTRWTPGEHPLEQEPWDRFYRVNAVLSEEDRREALGLERVRPA
jgi:hypothetical protein